MSTDKTLADVKPGGRVRLGDRGDALATLSARWRACADKHDENAREADSIGDMTATVQYLETNAEALRQAAAELDAALSAQPSPGGQGDARIPFETWAKDGGFDVSKFKGIYNSLETRAAWEAWLYWQRLAARQPVASNQPSGNSGELDVDGARQPVGEPVAYWLAVDKDGIVEFGMSADDGNEGQAARQEVNDFINGALHDGGVPHRLVGVYAAPPAQAVDLEQFRPAVCAMGLCAEQPEDVDEAKRLLALIESRGPRNG